MLPGSGTAPMKQGASPKRPPTARGHGARSRRAAVSTVHRREHTNQGFTGQHATGVETPERIPDDRDSLHDAEILLVLQTLRARRRPQCQGIEGTGCRGRPDADGVRSACERITHLVVLRPGS